MRVTNNMMTMNLLLNINRNLEFMSKKQDELATGKRIHSPSDDPVLASKILARRTDLAELEQYDKNTRDALGWLEITEKALEDNGNTLQRVRELCVQAANGVNTPSDTQKIKLEIENLKNQLISNGNSTFAGRYIFSGFETDKKLFNDDGTYNIDVDQYSIDNRPIVKYEVSVGEEMDVMTSGLDIYGIVPEAGLLAPDNNIMVDTFPSGSALGIASAKEYLHGTFDLTADYTAQNLDVVIGGVTYNIDTTNLDGSLRPIKKEALLTEYNNALGVNGSAYFNMQDELVIESANYGVGVPPMSVVSPAPFNPALINGVDKIEASVTGSVPLTNPLSAEDIDVLMNNNFNVIINGVSKKVKPDPAAVLVTPADYVAEIQTQLDNAFGIGEVSVSLSPAVPGPADIMTVSLLNTPDAKQSELTVDFPRVHESELMSDINDLIEFLEVGDSTSISSMIETIDDHLGNMLSLRADIGARVNRMDMIASRIASNNVSFTQLLSDAEDADMSEVIMLLKNAENVYQASLSTGARVIQPSLIDFLR